MWIKEPFPHCIIENFISRTDLERINLEWPDLSHKAKNTSIKGSTTALPPTADALVEYMNGPAFVKKLSRETGIDLIPDHSLSGGGLHEIRQGGFLKAHVDFNEKGLPDKSLIYRRLNALLYLNLEWRDEWGGHLNLYDAPADPVKMPSPSVSIAPLGGRLVMFETSNTSWHGHPEPLNTPNGVCRRSLALYYYSREPAQSNHERSSTIYRD